MAEKNIELDSVEIAAAVFGNCDRNIRLLENEFSVTAVCRGTPTFYQKSDTTALTCHGIPFIINNHIKCYSEQRGLLP